MNITLVRSATLILETRAGRLLLDPMLDPAGARPPIEGTANPVRNPTVELPFPPAEVVRGLDAVLVTHCHKDHLDDTAERLLPRDVPVFCQPEDGERLRALGLEARPVDDALDWNGLTLHRVPARHGTGSSTVGLRTGFAVSSIGGRAPAGSSIGSTSRRPAAVSRISVALRTRVMFMLDF